MKRITLKNLRIENFKGIRQFDGGFSDKTEVFGKNASGKTTLLDSFTWCLFGKDSQGRSDFQIRPLDETGAMIDNTEIKVAARLLISDAESSQEITLEKTQVQNWVKKRGAEAPTFQGNVNKYSVNGYPSTQKEYDAQVSAIIEESLFQLMTDPTAFAALPWKDQRAILVRFVSEITDEDILELDEATFAPISDEVVEAGVDKVREKYAATLKRLKEDQKAFPVRIDEAARSKVETAKEKDIQTLKDAADKELQAVQEARNGLSEAPSAASGIQNEIMQKRLRMAEIKRSAEYEDAKTNGAASTSASNALMALKKVESERDVQANKANIIKAAIKEHEADIAELSAQYKATVAREFPADQTTCPTCGRPFDSHKILKLKQEFRTRTAKNLEFINQRGTELREKINSKKAELETTLQNITVLTEKVNELDTEYRRCKFIADNPVKTAVEEIPEYKQLQAEIDELDLKLASLDNDDAAKEEIKNREDAARAMLAKVSEEYAKIEANERLNTRIEELKKQQIECSQKIADCEKIIYLLEKFTKLKMDTLSDRINSHFRKVRFKLFETQINGAIKETCKMQICTNGSYVDYSNANHAGQLIGGLDVIHALSELNQVSAPVFIDNAECFSSDNMPESDSQMILLIVSDDEKLTIEKGE